MKRLIEKWADVVTTYRWSTILLGLVATVMAGVAVQHLYFENSTDMWFLEDDPTLTIYRNHKKEFQNDEFLVVGIAARPGDEHVVNQDTIALVHKISQFLDEHKHVTKVRSLTTYQYLRESLGMLKVEELVPMGIEGPELSETDTVKIVEILKEERLARDLAVTADLKHTAVSARIVEAPDGENPKLELAHDFLAFAEKEGFQEKGWTLHLSGAAMINESYFRCSTYDQAIIYPIMMVIMLVMLACLFRTWVGVVLPAMVVVCSVVITLGLAGTLGWPLNMLNVTLPTILTVVGLGDAIHILVGFYAARNEGLGPREAAYKVATTLFLPCLYTSVTTCIGFFALSSSRLVPVIQFGLEAGIGVLIAFLLSVTVLPALLCSVKSTSRGGVLATGGSLNRLTMGIPSFAYRHRWVIAGAFVVILLPSMWFTSTLEADTSFERNFKEGFPIRTATRYFDEHYGGALALELTLDSQKEGGAKEPEFLNRVLELQRRLEAHEGTGRGLSLADYLMEINEKLNDGETGAYKLPDSRGLVAQYLLLYSNAGPSEDLSDMISFDETKLRLSVILKSRPASITKKWVDEIRTMLTKDFPELNASLTGRTVMFNNMDAYVQEGLISSFSIAFVLIIICFFVLLRSVKYGILAMLPSVFPILVAGGVMGMLNIYLDFATMMIAAVTMGIAVDDTVHFLWHYVQGRRKGMVRSEAVDFAIGHSGKAILLTSMILWCGFGMLVFSTFVPNIYFGVFGSLIILMALVGDLLVMPALIACRDRRASIDLPQPEPGEEEELKVEEKEEELATSSS
ncbi:hypothetical protein BVY04_03080 [bacterium M21]|nr:hypothetical protein BVY04_03080 [bacterium M21]